MISVLVEANRLLVEVNRHFYGRNDFELERNCSGLSGPESKRPQFDHNYLCFKMIFLISGPTVFVFVRSNLTADD